MEFLYFSFIQGILAFLAPCAVALLPGYIVAFISRDTGEVPGLKKRLVRGFKLASLSILGILAVYALAGSLILVASQLLKAYMKWVTIGMGGGLIIMGILMISGMNLSFSLQIQQASHRTEVTEAFIFGVAYAIGALGCLFPLFLVVATQAMAAPTLWRGASYILAYFVGLSAMMVAAILLSAIAKEVLMKYLRKILPYIERITGLLLVLAGAYVIYYQMALI